MQTSGPTWLRKGEAAEKSLEVASVGIKKRKDKEKRFWLKQENSTKIIFLDENPAEIFEHVIRPNGDYAQEWYDTCIGLENGCPHCKAERPQRQVWIYSVIDTTKFTKKDGTVIQNEKKLLCVPRRIQEMLKGKKKEYGGLAGFCFTVSRPDDKSPRCGGDFSIVLREGQLKKVNFEKLKSQGVDIMPFDYEAEFLPSYMAQLGGDLDLDDGGDVFDGPDSSSSAVVAPQVQPAQAVAPIVQTSPPAKPAVVQQAKPAEDDLPF